MRLIRKQESNAMMQARSKKEARDLYLKHMGVALDALKNKNRPVFDSHYQQAEYYLRLMHKPANTALRDILKEKEEHKPKFGS